ncbi:MAG TPA: nucleotide exchange factor GrpE [Thermopetrobacter sp.]|nr:nucleotide exchange factor GrpE [Thermopetrobacter sp.]
MSDDKNPNREQTTAPRADEPPRQDRPGEENAGLAAITAERDELKEQLLRALADMDNLRKRLQRERDEAVKYAAAAFARDLLPVADNLLRALNAVPEEKRREGSEFLRNLVEGVELTLNELLAIFERHGIRRYSPEGEKFDPHLHEAMFEVADSNADTGTIVNVVQDGYMHHDRVLRPARVGVARNGDGNAGGGDKGGD